MQAQTVYIAPAGTYQPGYAGGGAMPPNGIPSVRIF
jgi:hypothetical protein